MPSREELVEDINELKVLLDGKTSIIRSVRIQGWLKTKLAQQERVLAQLDEVVVAAAPVQKVSKVSASSSPTESFQEIQKFGYEDAGYGKKKVSIYIMSGIDGVGELPAESVTCDFSKTSFDLKIMGLGNTNYRLFKNNLSHEIIPSSSSFRVKKDRITITLIKKDDKEMWSSLTAKSTASSGLKDKSSDPSAGIMDMMQNMYNEGDAEMKRTIAKAWSESRNKTNAGGMPDMGM